MAPGRRQKKGTIMSKIASGFGIVLLCTIGLPVVIVGGSIQLLSTGLGKVFCSSGAYTNGKIQPMRRGVRVFPA